MEEAVEAGVSPANSKDAADTAPPQKLDNAQKRFCSPTHRGESGDRRPA